MSTCQSDFKFVKQYKRLNVSNDRMLEFKAIRAKTEHVTKHERNAPETVLHIFATADKRFSSGYET